VGGNRERQTAWPRITIVTPSFNQGAFIEETIRSILLQGYPDIEYFVLDGGSTDKSVEIIQKYSPWITFWVSERDGGQSAAINRGLKLGTGAYATWINSDDMLCKDALCNLPWVENTGDVVYVGDCLHIDSTGSILFEHRGRVHSIGDLVRVRSIWRSGWIDQPAVLFPLSLARRVGGLNEKNHYAMDYELWGQFLLAGAVLEYTGRPFGIFRWNEGQKTQDNLKQTLSTLEIAASLTTKADVLSAETKQDILAELNSYAAAYPNLVFKQSGRLAKIGLPSLVVNPIRSLKQRVDKKFDRLMKGGK
jgi:hypothetical protein